MTLAAVWVEWRTGGRGTLCFASDSRTTPGPIDGVTKVVLFGRPDLAGVWAGDYRYASLLLGHLDAVFTASTAMRRRDIDVDLAFRRAVGSVQRHIHHSMNPRVPAFERVRLAQEPETTTILVGGYSIVHSRFMLLRLHYNSGGKAWTIEVTPMDPAKPVLIGDRRKSAKQLLWQARAHRSSPGADDWQMEPLLVIYTTCEDPHYRSIGGVVQMAKVSLMVQRRRMASGIEEHVESRSMSAVR